MRIGATGLVRCGAEALQPSEAMDAMHNARGWMQLCDSGGSCGGVEQCPLAHPVSAEWEGRILAAAEQPPPPATPAPAHKEEPGGRWVCGLCAYGNNKNNMRCGGQGELGCSAPRLQSQHLLIGQR